MLPRFLSVPEVRSFLLRRMPEGVLPRNVLDTAISFAYAGGQSQPHVQVPSIMDSLVLHTVVNGYALGEMLACSAEHPLAATVLSVISRVRGQSLATTVASRRFCIDLNGLDILEYLEFAWMTDSRLLISYRWTKWTKDAPFMMGGEVCLYPPNLSDDPRFFSIGIPELRMSLTAQNCIVCGATHQSQCVCPPSVIAPSASSFAVHVNSTHDNPCDTSCLDLTEPSPAPLMPIRMSHGKSWAKFCDVFSSCPTRGLLRVSYRVGLPTDVLGAFAVIASERPVHDGIVPYMIRVNNGFPGVNELKQQFQVYMESSGALFVLPSEPLPEIDEGALKLIEQTLSSGEESETQNFDDYSAIDLLNLETINELPVDSRQTSSMSNTSADAQNLDDVKLVLPTDQNSKLSEIPRPDASSSNSWPLVAVKGLEESSSRSVASMEEQPTTTSMNSSDLSTMLQSQFRTLSSSDSVSTAQDDVRIQSFNPTCPACGAKFTRPSNLRRHWQSLHLRWKKAHQCSSCDRSFFSAVELRRHTAKHEAPRPECPQCGLKFRLKSALELHIAVVHGKQRPFKCNECGISFARKSALDRHRNSVHQGKRHSCPVCGASYSQPFDLKRHRQRAGHDGSVLADSPIAKLL